MNPVCTHTHNGENYGHDKHNVPLKQTKYSYHNA